MSSSKLPFGDNLGILHIALDKKHKQVKSKNDCKTILVTGKERQGKSTLAAQMANYLKKGHLKIEDICFDLEELLHRFRTGKKGDVIIFDEAGTVMYSRTSMSKEATSLQKIFMILGRWNYLLFILLPNPKALDKHMIERIDLWIHITKRGKFVMWGLSCQERLREVCNNKKSKTPVAAKGWFNKQFPPHLEKAYLSKERAKKHGLLDKLIGKKDKLKVPQYAKQTGYSVRQVRNWIRDKKIKADRIGGHWYIPQGQEPPGRNKQDVKSSA